MHTQNSRIVLLDCESSLETQRDNFPNGRCTKNTKLAFSISWKANHLFFDCCNTRFVWNQVLKLLKVNHSPLGWEFELAWLSQRVKGKSCRSKILKMAAA